MCHCGAWYGGGEGSLRMKTCSRRRRSRDPINVAASSRVAGLFTKRAMIVPWNGMPQVASGGGVIAGLNGTDEAVDVSADCGCSGVVEVLGKHGVPLAFQLLQSDVEIS